MDKTLPLVVAPFCMMIPFVGYLFTPIALILIVVEAIMLFSQKSRLGDRMAGTMVIKK